MDGVTTTPLRRIYHPKGDVLHALKSTESDYQGFGEAYFTTIIKNETKGWKKHQRMTMNLIVPTGSVRFFFRKDDGPTEFIDLSDVFFFRLTVALRVVVFIIPFTGKLNGF